MNELNQVNSANLFLILRRYLEKEKILLVEEKEREDKYLEDVSFFGGEKNCEQKGGKYLEEENISLWRRRKMEKE